MRALIELLVDILSVDDARLFVANHCPEVEASIRWREARRDVMRELAVELSRRGLITDAFFDALVAARPGRCEDIDALRASQCQSHTAGPPSPTNIPSRAGRPFVGRNDELQQVAELLDAHQRVVVIAGQSGVGKSELSFRYAEKFKARYPGGCYRVHLFSKVAPPELAQLGYARFGIKAGDAGSLEGDCVATLAQLGASERTLLIYDNVPDIEAIGPWLPSGGLCDCVITSTSRDWPHLQVVTLTPLAQTQADELLSAFEVPAGEVEVRAHIIDHGGGLPAHLCPEALAAVKRIKMGLNARPALVSGTAAASLDMAWELLSDDAQLLLRIATWFEPRSIPVEKVRTLLVGEGWGDERVDDALTRCFDRYLLELGMRMHDLTASYVRSLDTPVCSEHVVASYVDEMVSCALAYQDSPNDAVLAEQFAAYPWRDAAWLLEAFGLEEHAATLADALHEAGRYTASVIFALKDLKWIERQMAQGSAGDLNLGRAEHRLGAGLLGQGDFEGALSWFTRVVRHQEQSDGQPDYITLGDSLQKGARCLCHLGRYEESLRWYERAHDLRGRGLSEGQVDAQRVGGSLLGIGYCHGLLGRHEEAQRWLVPAIEQVALGDAQGRVDHEKLGMGLHYMAGSCFQLRRYEDALVWVGRSVEHQQCGDVHGRINHLLMCIGIHLGGECHYRLSRCKEALSWASRAIKHGERGDVLGRTDDDLVGRSVYLAGQCHVVLGELEEARQCFERAARLMSQGNVHQQVDYESLATTLESLATVCRRLGNDTAAEAATRRAAVERAKLPQHDGL